MRSVMTERAHGAADAGWNPLRGSYEEAVLSWYEQVEMSFRRRALEARRARYETRVRPGEATALPVVNTSAGSDGPGTGTLY